MDHVVYAAEAVADVETDTITWSLTGTDAGLFDINSDGEVTFKSTLTSLQRTPDHEAKSSYSFNVVASVRDADTSKNEVGTRALPCPLQISMTMPRVSPILTLDAVPAGQAIRGGAAGYVVYTATAAPDVTGDDSVWSLTGDAANLFRIDDGVVRFVADTVFRAGGYSFTVTATTGTGDAALSSSQTVTWAAGTTISNQVFGDLDDNSWTGQNDVSETYFAGLGADDIDGGTGTTADTVSYRWSHEGVTVALDDSASTGGTAAGDTLINIENLIGSSFDDMLTGDGGANTLNGGAGDDTLTGGAGTDTASYAGAGAGVTVTLATQGLLKIPLVLAVIP